MTSVAIELEKIYPIHNESLLMQTRFITIGYVLHAARSTDPLPKVESQHSQRLGDFLSGDEWEILQDLNNFVNPELHSVLETAADGHSKEVSLSAKNSANCL